MERIALTENLKLSRIVYGMWRVGDDADTSARHVEAKVEACLAQGITTIDQADIYGGYTAEAILGAALKASPGLRARLEIVTKCAIMVAAGRYGDVRVKHYDTSRAHILASVEHSLRDLHTDHVDLLLIHRPDPLMDHEATGRALDDLVASGKVRAVGVSNFRPHDVTLLASAMTQPLVTNQIEISVMQPAAFSNGDLAYLQERAMPVMAWSPLGGGALFGEEGSAVRAVLERLGARHGVDASAVAVAFLLAHPARIMPVMGTNSLDRIARFGDALRVSLDRQDWFEIYSAALGREVA